MQSEPHRKRIKHYEETRQLHELTFSCYQRMPLLTNDVWRGLLAKNLTAACESEAFRLIAFVFMPEHVHLLVCPMESRSRVSRLLALTKQPTSKAIKEMLVDSGASLLERLTVRERPGKYCFRFWQEGPGYDRNIFSPEAIEASINYVHENPVKRGLCQDILDWRWSSARFHHEGLIDLALPLLHKPLPEWFDSFGVQTEHG